MGKETVNFDWISFILLICIGLFGLFILLTINTNLFLFQALYLVVGFALLLLISSIDNAILIWFAPLGYILGCLSLAITYLSKPLRGAQRWIDIFGVQLQPSEIAKPLFLLAFAFALSRYSPRKVKNIPLHIFLFLLPFVLIFRQPDLGTAIVYLSFWLSMLIAGGIPFSILGTTIVGGSLFLPFLWKFLADYQRARIFTFINPGFDPQGAGYNAIQAMIAVGSGKLFGRGLGLGTQSHLQFLPEYHNDFIFATLVEELGFFGGALLLIAYFFLLWRVITPLIHGKVTDGVVYIYSIGLLIMLLSQIIINSGMNMGLIPVTGITLPFVSFGGSSVLSLSLSFGILWALYAGKGRNKMIEIR